MSARTNLLSSLERNLRETRSPELRARLLAAVAALKAAPTTVKFKRKSSRGERR